MATTAPSVETRVRVLRLLNMRATVLPKSALGRCAGVLPDLIEALYVAALRTRVVSSAVERSAMERKCRGAKGEVGGVEGLAALCDMWRRRECEVLLDGWSRERAQRARERMMGGMI